jgi:hypothetical protein
VATGPFTLSKPIAPADPARVPVKGDLAHIALAGRYFVPHYVVPRVHVVGPSGADVLAAGRADAEMRAHLEAGATFDVLEDLGEWVWGCAALDGPTGFVRRDNLSVAR